MSSDALRICFLILVFLTSASKASTLDSLRMEVRNEGSFVVHQVVAKETLYSLSKRYGTTIADIVKHNPGAENGLAIGDVLSIPYTRENARITHIVKESETLYSISRRYNVSIDDLKEWNKLKNNDLKLGQPLRIYPKNEELLDTTERTEYEENIHVVQSGETLFSISKQYGISVKKLRKLNKLESNDISIGKSLQVQTSKSKKSDTKDKEQPTEPTEPVNIEEEPQVEEKKAPVPDTIYVNYRKQPKRIENASGFESIVENGLAEVIENNTDTRKYLALHREAPVGTLMQVRNEETGLRVFVRVVGKLPDTVVNEQILIKISKPAFDRLGAVNKRFPVVVSYVP